MSAQTDVRVPPRWILTLCVALLAPGAVRAEEWFIKVDGVPGMLAEGRFAGWTRIYSADALGRLPLNSPNGGFGPASFACEVRKALDGVSPALLQSCVRGEPYSRVSLACVLTQPHPRLHRITMDNAFVASVRQEGGTAPGTVEQETVYFASERIEMSCLDLDVNGGVAGGLAARLDPASGVGDLRTRPPFRVTITQQNGRRGVVLTWTAERGHRYALHSRGANGGVWKTSSFVTATADGPLSHFLPTDTPDLLMRVEEVD